MTMWKSYFICLMKNVRLAKFNCVCGGMCPALIEEGVDSDCTLRKNYVYI